jgi:hypothetical protein
LNCCRWVRTGLPAACKDVNGSDESAEKFDFTKDKKFKYSNLHEVMLSRRGRKRDRRFFRHLGRVPIGCCRRTSTSPVPLIETLGQGSRPAKPGDSPVTGNALMLRLRALTNYRPRSEKLVTGKSNSWSSNWEFTRRKSRRNLRCLPGAMPCTSARARRNHHPGGE